jgi:hypothetical protein
MSRVAPSSGSATAKAHPRRLENKPVELKKKDKRVNTR